MRFAVLVLVAVGFAGCAGRVDQKDLDAWAGVHVSELARHEVFAPMTKRTEDLGEGRQLWTFSNCNYVAVGNGNVVTAQPVCCANQFTVKGDRIESYQTVGKCRTNCSVRPASRSCG